MFRMRSNLITVTVVAGVVLVGIANTLGQSIPSSSAKEVVSRIQASEQRIRDMQVNMAVYAEPFSATSGPVEELTWGFEGGKEFFRGIERLGSGWPEKGPVTETLVDTAFNGERTFMRRQSKDGYSSGAVRPFDPMVFAVEFSPNQMLGTVARMNGRASLGDVLSENKEVSLLDKMEDVNGQSCVVVEAIGTDKYPGFSYNTRVWVAPSLDYRPVRIEAYHQKFDRFPWLILRTRVEVTKFATIDGIWFPVEGEKSSYVFQGFDPPAGMSVEEFNALPDSQKPERGKARVVGLPPRHRVVVDPRSVKLNLGIPADAFTIRFPNGCRVWDEFIGKGYIAGVHDDESMKALLSATSSPALPASAASTSPAIGVSSIETTAAHKERRTGAERFVGSIFITAVVVVGGGMIALLVWSRLRRRQRA